MAVAACEKASERAIRVWVYEETRSEDSVVMNTCGVRACGVMHASHVSVREWVNTSDNSVLSLSFRSSCIVSPSRSQSQRVPLAAQQHECHLCQVSAVIQPS